MTLLTGEVRLRRLIDAAAAWHVLPVWVYEGNILPPGVFLEGLILAESGGKADAVRYEPHQDRPGRSDAHTDPDRPGIDDGVKEDDRSYGLMQIMGYNYRRYCGAPVRTALDFSPLFRPMLNIDCGCWILNADLLAVAREVEAGQPPTRTHDIVARALARYNGGPTGDDIQPNGKMRLQRYVDRVGSHALAVLRDRQAAGWRA